MPKANVPWFQRQHYQAIKRLVTDKPMPETFDEWLQAADKDVGEMLARGVTVEKVVIDPQEFTAYRDASGIDHNSATLGAFAVAMARKKHERRT